MMSMEHEKPTIGFIGVGVMGASMARHLLETGYPLNVFTRTKSKADSLLRDGAAWMSDAAALAERSQVVITIVGFPADVEAVYLGDRGLIANSAPGTVLIDMTTSSPLLARRIASEAADRGLHTLDAPVSGGDVGAREARLSIMVGGEKVIFEKVLPILQCMGKQIVYQGLAGSGQHTKMANQIAIAAGMLGVCEALAYARDAGLNPETVLRSIGSGAAGSWSLNHLGPRMIQGDFTPGFFVKHFIKDMRIAVESARELGTDTPGLDLARRRYETLAAQGNENDGTQALFRLYSEEQPPTDR